ncbi:putative 8-oxoguanine DNA-glycosylase [Seiridium unicorne]|uniref:DNA-(apurinic or apyrimidinic site) lyase n=1 Tax=Seiridium unicorne TaxID=138068 RepID=A0ABR2V279_9PEZI
MPTLKISEWRKLPLSLRELCIDTTLRCGQSFRWRKTDDEWHMTLHGRILSLKQDDTHLHYKATWPAATTASASPPASVKEVSSLEGHADDTEDLLRHYFSLKHNAAALYEQWSENDPNFRKKAPKFTGIRILSQDAWEALIGFICSSNNNISRISQMVHKLCNHYGPLIGHIGDEPYHDFPTPEALAGKKVEAHLRELGFGYRAKYIAQTARMVSEEKPKEWLESLTNPENPGWGAEKYGQVQRASYKEAHEQLLSLSGVGPKVADCVCLMGLGWGEAVPVDTHVWQIAQRDYKFGKVKTKTFSKVMYDSVGDHFRKIWGDQAGWAQSVLFTANLKSFSDRTTTKPESDNIKIELEENVVIEESTRKAKRKHVTMTAKVKLEETPIDIASTTDGKRRKTRSSMAR